VHRTWSWREIVKVFKNESDAREFAAKKESEKQHNDGYY